MSRNNNKGRKPKFDPKEEGRKPSVGRDKSEGNTKDKKRAKGDVNNPGYYYENETVLNQVMNFSFNEFGDVPMSWMANLLQSTDYDNPMIATFSLNPSVPEIDPNWAGTFGTTTASLRNFIMLSGSNAKTTNYAPQDVLILEMALAEVIKMATFCARAFGAAYLFNYRNRSYPERLFEGMCIDHDDFTRNLAAYRVRFNKLLTLAAKIPFPASIPCFAKATSIYASFYLDDENSALAQTYMFVPYSTWEFDEAYSANGAGLKTVLVCVPGTIKTFDAYLDILENQLSALLNSTTLNFIYSDVIRLNQSGKLTNMLTFTAIPDGYTVVPVYNKEVEDWLHNAIIMGEPLAMASQISVTGMQFSDRNDVESDASNNRIIYHPQFKFNADAGYEALIDFDHDNVSVEEKVRATRFAQRYMNTSSSGNFYATQVALSDHYIVRWNIYYGGTMQSWNTSFVDFSNFSMDATLLRVANLTKFDWCPIIYGHDSNVTKLRPIGDLDYYTTINMTFMERVYDYEVIHYYQIG